MSVWPVLYGSGSDQALITLARIDHHTFRYLLHNFELLYQRLTPYSDTGCLVEKSDVRRRKRTINATDCLDLTLCWYRTQGSTNKMCMVLGLSMSVFSLFPFFCSEHLRQNTEEGPVSSCENALRRGDQIVSNENCWTLQLTGGRISRHWSTEALFEAGWRYGHWRMFLKWLDTRASSR